MLLSLNENISSFISKMWIQMSQESGVLLFINI